jgi:O-antigen biosynthesis protein
MPTRDRREFVLQSIIYFGRQDYPARELIILDDGDPGLAKCVSGHQDVRYFHLDSDLSIGKKRDMGCALAQGGIVAQWDDDDWHAPGRLSEQVAPLLAGTADMTGLAGVIGFDTTRWEFWRGPRAQIIDGTLVFRRQIWGETTRYPNQSFGESGAFLRRATRRGAVVESIANNGLYLYVRHATNCAWSDDLMPRGWVCVAEPELPAADRDFYLALHQASRSF